MDAVLGIIAPVFWGVLVLSALVVVHEGGHFLAARICGVRVTEFFIGMPCRYNIHRVSRRTGTMFGVTPLLLGGYAAICGMDPDLCACAPAVLAAIHERGTASVEDLAAGLDLSEDDVMDACAQLMSWGSIVAHPDGRRVGADHPTVFAAPARDRAGFIQLDGKLFDRSSATREGESWHTDMPAQVFFEREKSHTYLGQGFLKRSFMLLAGIGVNILVGFLLLVSVYSIIGTTVTVNSNSLGEVTQGSIAASAGLAEGDIITSINGVDTPDWVSITDALADARGKGPFEIAYLHDGAATTTTVALGVKELLGINAPSVVIRLNPVESAQLSVRFIAATAQAVGDLINPTRTMQVLEGSTSIVGVSILSAQAAAAGPAVLLQFAALISFSLGFMNLLPIPPLDGGKFLIEIIQAVIRRPVPTRVQNGLSYAGLALVLLLFVYMLQADIARFIL